MQLFWFIPTHGDGRYLGTSKGSRATNYGYLRQIAEAADDLGFTGVLLPTGRSCDDSWIVASMLVPVTRRLKFLVALRPGLISPTAAARMTATLDRFSEGRLLLNVVTGGDPQELGGDGIFHDHDARYEVTDEFLTIWNQLLQLEEVNHRGKHLRIEKGKLLFPGFQHPRPPLYFGGSSPAGIAVAARHVDIYLTWGEPPAQVAKKIAQARKAAAAEGRTLRFGIRLHVIVRETAREAWAAADDLIRHITPKAIAKAQATFARFDSEGQRRMSRLHGGRRDKLEISPNLWAGVGLLRGGSGTALVGDAKTVARRIKEYAALGIETFILSGYPHLEEAHRVAELLFPLLPLDHPASSPQGPHYVGPYGEVMANQKAPRAASRTK